MQTPDFKSSKAEAQKNSWGKPGPNSSTSFSNSGYLLSKNKQNKETPSQERTPLEPTFTNYA